MDHIIRSIRKVMPQWLFSFYHFVLAVLGALIYRFPSRKLHVIGVTGTKGKSTVTELLNAILEEAGYTTALASTVRFKIGKASERNFSKMTMPGRFFLQSFLRRAAYAKCDFAILEMTSEGIKQFRHFFIDLDALIFTNLTPEHIEAHGSYEAYVATKLRLARALERSSKRPRAIIANRDDAEGKHFLEARVEKKHPFSLEDAKPYEVTEHGSRFTFKGKQINSKLSGTFNIYNMLSAAECARSQGVELNVIAQALEKFKGVPGRLEKVRLASGNQRFSVVVDYAHTPESLEAVYKMFSKTRKICVLGAAGGGRDKWKRPLMGKIASQYCNVIILTNEDPYDEDPIKIVEQIKSGIPTGATHEKQNLLTIINRRKAVRKALELAEPSDTVLITGKGTDPYIMEANGRKIPWNEKKIVHEELKRVLSS